MLTFLSLSVLQLVFFSADATRARLDEEIIPESAEQSHTYNNDEFHYATAHAIDGDLRTTSGTLSGGRSWLKVKLAKLSCIKQVIWMGIDATPKATWTCTRSGCNCKGLGSNCSKYLLSINTERSSPGDMPSSADCKNGDTAQITLWRNGGLMVFNEIVITGKQQSVDGGWGAFGSWSDCSAECGWGTQTRTRHCNNPAPVGGGADCVGNDTESQACYTQPCQDVCEDEKAATETCHRELEEVKEELAKASCPGEGIYTVPGKVIGKKISKKMLKNMKKNEEWDNLRYLSPWKNVKITKDITKYIECFTTKS